MKQLFDISLKIEKRIWQKLVRIIRLKSYYYKIYSSFWHYKFHSTKTKTYNINYFAAIPNPGAGIGHQMANWIAGYWYAKQFGLKFAHIPFSTQKWESFLGFGDNEITVKELTEEMGYKKVTLPLFAEFNQNEVVLIKNIIASYNDKKVVFIAEQDQFYRDQFGVMEQIKYKFYHTKAREDNQFIYNKGHVNIAIHVRRGDIGTNKSTANDNLAMRWQENDYFINVLHETMANIKSDKPIFIYLFSQGKEEDYPEFSQFKNLQFCLEMNAIESFLHMVYADVLIISKSSFSYKPALLSNGTKVCPNDFWHGYPTDNDWIMVDETGTFIKERLINI